MGIRVNDLGSNFEENIERWAKRLRRPGATRSAFKAIYSSQKKTWTTMEIAAACKLSTKKSAEAAKTLYDLTLLERPDESKAVYRKRPDVYRAKRQILSLADNPTKLKNLPTKRKILVSGASKMATSTFQPRSIAITVDDIDDFRKVREVNRDKVPASLDPVRLPENVFKEAIRLILNERAKLKDWGGEELDLFSTNLCINQKRYAAGFALKGPGKSGVLTPGKMGKNGDQIQRLLNGPIQVAIVQYEGAVATSVYTLVEKLAREKALTQNKNVYYCIVDMLDSYRLRIAYWRQFKRAQRD